MKNLMFPLLLPLCLLTVACDAPDGPEIQTLEAKAQLEGVWRSAGSLPPTPPYV